MFIHIEYYHKLSEHNISIVNVDTTIYMGIVTVHLIRYYLILLHTKQRDIPSICTLHYTILSCTAGYQWPMFLLFRADVYKPRPTVSLSKTNMHITSMLVRKRKDEEQQIVNVIITGLQNVRIKQMVCLC